MGEAGGSRPILKKFSFLFLFLGFPLQCCVVPHTSSLTPSLGKYMCERNQSRLNCLPGPLMLQPVPGGALDSDPLTSGPVQCNG